MPLSARVAACEPRLGRIFSYRFPVYTLENNLAQWCHWTRLATEIRRKVYLRARKLASWWIAYVLATRSLRHWRHLLASDQAEDMIVPGGVTQPVVITHHT